MNASQLQNALRIMHSLDEANDVLGDEAAAFHKDPIGTAIRMDATTFSRIFELIDCRMDPVAYRFKKALRDISFARAGWDVQGMSHEQRQAENKSAADALGTARVIWADNPAKHRDLVAAFKEVGPLATLDEITRVKEPANA